MELQIIALTSFHPLKLEKSHWNQRELEYIEILKDLKYFEDFILVDNSINNLKEILNIKLVHLINSYDFPVSYNNNILKKNLYSEHNDYGLVLMLRDLAKKISANKNYIFINGRITNYQNLLKDIELINFTDDFLFFKSKLTNNICSDIFILNGNSYNEFIRYFDNFNIEDNFDLFFSRFASNKKVELKNLGISKILHYDNNDYLKTKNKLL
jgi:hypothetical protein